MGIAVSVAAGVLLAVAIHLSRTMRRATYPLLVASQTIPIVIVAPLLVAWLGYDLAPKLAIVGLICFFPVVVYDPRRALPASTPTCSSSCARSTPRAGRPSATSRARPRCRHLLSGAKIAVTVAVIGAVLAEQAGSSDGLGHLSASIPQFETARSWAAVVVLAAFAIVLFGALALAKRRLVPWAHRSEGDVA